MSSTPTRLVSLRITEQDYAKLSGQAESLGLRPAVLARLILRTSLHVLPEPPPARGIAELQTALARLDPQRVASDGGPDAVEVIRRGREARDARLMPFASPPSRDV